MKTQLICALYGDPGTPEPAFLKFWWEAAEIWAISLGAPPNEVSARYRHKPKGMCPGHGYDLSKYRSRIQRELETGNVTALALTALRPNWKYKAVDWEFEAMLGEDRSAGMVCAAGIDVEKLRAGSSPSPRMFAGDAVDRIGRGFAARYGFAVTMPQRFMPEGYALGIAGEVPQDMVHDCNAWSRYAGRQCGHALRNVFGYNVLNHRHLDINVGGQRLGDWIEASSDRGRIESRNGVFTWTFQEGDDEEAFLLWDYPPVVSVREQLKQHNIFSWQHFPGVC